jgi:hypothetical protein
MHMMIGRLANPITVIKTSPSLVVEGKLVSATVPFAAVVVKLLREHSCAIELVCGWLGIAAGLPVPNIGRIHVSNSIMPHGTEWPYETDQTTTFASALIQTAQSVISTNSHAVDVRLKKWPLVELAGVFDELIANDDRSQGNVLLDARQNFWLIDHARALGGAGQRLFSTEVFPSFTNFFLQRIASESLDERLSRKQTLLASCVQLRTCVPRIPYSDLGISSDIEREIRAYLSARLRNLEHLVLSRVELPDLAVSSTQQLGAH